MRSVGAAIIAACASVLSACATSPEAIQANDPLEPMNRAVYHFDERFDKYVVLPVAFVYVYYLPHGVHRGLHNFVSNLDLPVTFANDVLQGEVTRAGSTLGRFALNSTAGFGGIFDPASTIGLDYRPTDFGTTLGRYGVPEGPFLVLPVIGPEMPRDLVGDGADLFADPLFYLPPGAPLYERTLDAVGLHIANPFEEHARNIVLRQELERGSVDPYVTMRSIYRQQREEEVSEGVPSRDDQPSSK